MSIASMNKRHCMSKFKVIFISVFCCAGLFSAISLVFYFGDWLRLIIVATMGVLTGLLIAPSIDPKAFKYPVVYQLLCGSFIGGALALVFTRDPWALSVGVLSGGLLGFLTPYWIKNFPIP